MPPKDSMGMSINKWGPAAWNILHVISHTIPESPSLQQRSDLYSFVKLFGHHIPCPKCRDHFMEMVNRDLEGPECEHLKSRENFVMFMNNLHNEVNQRLGKETFTLKDHYFVYSRYTNMASVQESLSHVNSTHVIVLVCISATLGWYFMKHASATRSS